MIVKEQKTYKTNDLYFASFLKTAGYSLLRVENDSKFSRKLFVFEVNDSLEKINTEYINGLAKVSAKDLIDNIRALKNLIHFD